jgi:hypothetical protein
MEIKPGNIIKRRISRIFWHMGIYIGNDKVIHYHNPGRGKKADKGIMGKGAATIRQESLEKFAEEGKVFIHAEPVDEAHGKEVIKKAKNFYKNPRDYNGQYNLVTKNCEHFATTCFGEGYSPMKQTTKTAVAIAVAVGTAVAARKGIEYSFYRTVLFKIHNSLFITILQCPSKNFFSIIILIVNICPGIY